MAAAKNAPGGMTERSKPRAWVLVAGGLMALGWVLLIMALATEQIGAALTFLFLIMLPVNIWWRYMLRRERKAVGRETLEDEAGRFGAVLRAFVAPMPAAFAEWRASR